MRSGRPKCVHGDAERSESTGRCLICKREDSRRRYDPDKERKRKSHETKEHRRLKSSRWRGGNAANAREHNRRWAAAHPEQEALRTSKYRARQRGAEGTVSVEDWRSIVARQGGRCAHCGETRKLERDHIVPLSRGGSNLPANIQGLCRSCNARKGDRPDLHFGFNQEIAA